MGELARRTGTDGKLLVRLAEQIRHEHQQVAQIVRHGLEHAKRAGLLLLQAKEHLQHGQWLPWLENNVGVSIRTAQLYMQIAGRWGELEGEADDLLSVNDARRLLIASGDGNRDGNGRDVRIPPACRPLAPADRPADERQARLRATVLIHGDCRGKLADIPSRSVDCVVTDPPYPQVNRSYGKLSENQWHDLMHEVVSQCRRILKPAGSMAVIVQPNYDKIGKMRLWAWDFLLWAAREWNLVQDAYCWVIDALPLAGTKRQEGLLRQSVKLCIWLGDPGCYRNQSAVLWTPSLATLAHNRSDHALRTGPSGRTYRHGVMTQTAEERGGSVPFNLLPISNGGKPGGAGEHPATTSYDLAAWWCRYLLPAGGTLLDPFAGSGTMLLAGLDNGAGQVIGIEKERKYLKIVERRIANG